MAMASLITRLRVASTDKEPFGGTYDRGGLKANLILTKSPLAG